LNRGALIALYAIMGFLVPEQSLAKAAALTVALILSPFVAAITLGRRKARMLQREIDELNALMGEP
jgi:hypothetical protein